MKLNKHRKKEAVRARMLRKTLRKSDLEWPTGTVNPPVLDESAPNLDSKFTKGGTPIHLDDYFIKGKNGKAVRMTLDKDSPIHAVFQGTAMNSQNK